jgi:hypothetical protein
MAAHRLQSGVALVVTVADVLALNRVVVVGLGAAYDLRALVVH